MSRPKGSKNVGAHQTEPARVVTVTEGEKEKISSFFTCIPKDLIGISDLMATSGLSYETCARIVREIKAVSDIFGIQGYVHRTDYFLFVSRKFAVADIPH